MGAIVLGVEAPGRAETRPVVPRAEVAPDAAVVGAAVVLAGTPGLVTA